MLVQYFFLFPTVPLKKREKIIRTSPLKEKVICEMRLVPNMEKTHKLEYINPIET
jgi:hypothetical protein